MGAIQAVVGEPIEARRFRHFVCMKPALHDLCPPSPLSYPWDVPALCIPTCCHCPSQVCAHLAGLLPFKRRKQRDLLDALTAPLPPARQHARSSDMFDSSNGHLRQFRHASANEAGISSLVPDQVRLSTPCGRLHAPTFDCLSLISRQAGRHRLPSQHAHCLTQQTLSPAREASLNILSWSACAERAR